MKMTNDVENDRKIRYGTGEIKRRRYSYLLELIGRVSYTREELKAITKIEFGASEKLANELIDDLVLAKRVKISEDGMVELV